MKVYYLCVCLLVSYIYASNDLQDSKLKLIIDNDAGADDAMAIFLALLYEKHFDGPKVLGLTTVQGNVREDQGCINNQRFLKVAQRQDVPIFRGSKDGLVHTTPPTGDYFGADGLGDSNEPLIDLLPAQDTSAVQTLIEYSKTYNDELVVIALGPLTNIALAIKLDPGFLRRLKQLYVAGGHIHSKDFPTPEFNANMDVEAYKVVMDNAAPGHVTVLPFSQTYIHLELSKNWRENTFGAIKTDMVEALNIFARVALNNSEIWCDLDPVMVACVLNEDLVKEYKYSKQNIITCDKQRGMTTNEFVEEMGANVKLIYSLDRELYKNFLLKVFSAELGK